MISQYIYMQPNNRWVEPAIQSALPFSQIMKAKLGAALSLSLNLFALDWQQQKLRQIQSGVISRLASKYDSKLSRKSSETVDASQKYIISFQKGEKLKQNILNGKNEKTRKFSTFTNLTPVDCKEVQPARSAQGQSHEKQNFFRKKVTTKMRRHIPKSFRQQSKATKMEEKLKKIKKVSLICTAEISGQISTQQRYRKLMNLLERMVKSWNPSKQESYIKNREFRMLIQRG